jgi:DNA-binding protein H-NS
MKKAPVMARFNLDKLSLAELKSLQKDVTKAIAEFSERKQMKAPNVLEAYAMEFGFSLAELTGSKKSRKSSARPGAKYRHPEDAEVTWSGSRRQPGWFRDSIKAGRSADPMAV